MSVEAQFSGVCIDCDDRLHEGDRIEFVENRGWVHETCPDPIEKRASICDTCFTERPCGCDDE